MQLLGVGLAFFAIAAIGIGLLRRDRRRPIPAKSARQRAE